MDRYKFRAWDINKVEVRRGGKGWHKQNGYILYKAPYHPCANKRGYVPHHRLLIENHLGRYLDPRTELVHHIDGNRENNEISNLKLTTPSEHYIEEHYEGRNPNGRFAATDPMFEEIKFRLFDRDKNITQIYTLKELISKTYRREKFEFRGRYTGLKDKNGKEIYEGDLLQDEFGIGEVEWVQEHCAYMVFSRNPSKYYYLENDVQLNSSEVIGNIHDNPDLLEG